MLRVLRLPPLGKHVTEEELLELVKLCDAKDGDMVFIGTGVRNKVASFMGALRLKTARDHNLVHDGYKALWVVDFPDVRTPPKRLV